MSDALDDLIGAYVDGSASDDEVAALDRALREDPVAAQRFAELALVDDALRQVHRLHASARATGVVSPSGSFRRGSDSGRRAIPSARSASGRRRAQRRRRHGGASVPLMLAAAAVALITVGIFWSLAQGARSPSQPEPTPVVQDGPREEPPSAAHVARLVRGDARRGDGTRIVAGSGLAYGARVEGSGLLRLDDGSVIGLDGLLRLPERSGETIVLLERGSIEATVRPRLERNPFRVHSVHGRATVLGTVLTVAVTQDGTRVHVREGRVAVASAGDDGAEVVLDAHDEAVVDTERIEIRRTVVDTASWREAGDLPVERVGDLLRARYDNPTGRWRGRAWYDAERVDLARHSAVLDAEVEIPSLREGEDKRALSLVVTPELALDDEAQPARFLRLELIGGTPRIVGRARADDRAEAFEVLWSGARIEGSRRLRLQVGVDRVRAWIDGRLVHDGPHGFAFAEVHRGLRFMCRNSDGGEAAARFRSWLAPPLDAP